jgi:hypothetical protein
MEKYSIAIAIVLLISATSFIHAQWYSEKVQDPFDGDVILVYGKGSGGNFPYKSPTIVFRRTQGINEIYFSGMGYTGCDNTEIKVSFGDPNKIISFRLNESTDSDAGFINMNDVQSIYSLIVNLKNKSRAYFRFQSDCNTNSFEMSLKGSSNALNIIYSKEVLQRLKREVSFVSGYDVDVSDDKLFLNKETLFEDSKNKWIEILSEESISLSTYDMERTIEFLEEKISVGGLPLTGVTFERAYPNAISDMGEMLRLKFKFGTPVLSVLELPGIVRNLNYKKD